MSLQQIQFITIRVNFTKSLGKMVNFKRCPDIVWESNLFSLFVWFCCLELKRSHSSAKENTHFTQPPQGPETKHICKFSHRLSLFGATQASFFIPVPIALLIWRKLLLLNLSLIYNWFSDWEHPRKRPMAFYLAATRETQQSVREAAICILYYL